MKCTCKQCGKTFEITDSEIAFFKSKNLSIPKRCKECRALNKQKNNTGNTEQPNYYSNKNKKKFSPAFGILIAVVLVALVGLGMSHVDKLFSSDNQPYEIVETTTNSANSSTTNAKITTTEAEYVTSDTITTTANPIESTAEEKYYFRNDKLLSEHYEKHGIEMGFASKEDYQAAASQVIENPNALHKKEAEDNDDVYYLESTGEFVILSTDGYIRTYYIADYDYYERQ